MKNQLNDSKPHVVIIGAGFGGLRVARQLRNKAVRVTLVDRNNYHLFQPLLYQVATSGISSDEIAYPVRATLRRQENADFLLAEVKNIDMDNKQLKTTQVDLKYDYLVIAVGGETNYFGLNTVAEKGFGLKTLEDSTRLRNHILRQFELANHEPDPEKKKAMLTFVIVGGGPTGVECAGAISELINVIKKIDFPRLDMDVVRVVLAEMKDSLLPGMASKLGKFAEDQLREKKHIEIHLGDVVKSYDGKTVIFQEGDPIPTNTLIWAAGIQAASLTEKLKVEKGRSGRIVVDPTLQVPGYPDVFAIGDAAYFEEDGAALPMVAPVAMQQAKYTAENILALNEGNQLKTFQYEDPGIMATIGRGLAVAQLGRFKFDGALAWLVWLGVHIMQLIGFRNRMIVLINWGWDYLLYERAVRLISTD